jgi:regulator of extracellular matrix RemA (YlzA/DUF370 family)
MKMKLSEATKDLSVDGDQKILHHLRLKNNLKEGDLISITYGKQEIGKYYVMKDKDSIIESTILVETSFEVSRESCDLIN